MKQQKIGSPMRAITARTTGRRRFEMGMMNSTPRAARTALKINPFRRSRAITQLAVHISAKVASRLEKPQLSSPLSSSQ